MADDTPRADRLAEPSRAEFDVGVPPSGRASRGVSKASKEIAGYDRSDLAFSDIVNIVEPKPKPRKVGLTEVRTPAHSLPRLRLYVETLGHYLDSVKWTCGTQRLLPRQKVLEINNYLHDNNIEVSSGGFIEKILPLGEKAIHRYLEQSKELGFDIMEISSAFVAISLKDKCNIVRAAREIGLKPKPEINAWSPGDRGHVSADKVLHEAEALLEAGAWTIMIEEDGIFSSGNNSNVSSEWRRDIAWRIASRIPNEHLYWEASDTKIIIWLLNAFGSDVNIFSGDEWLGYIAAFRTGVFAVNIAGFGE